MVNDEDGYESKLNTPHTKVWAKTGSKYDAKNPTVKCEWTFDESVEPKTVFEAVSSDLCK